MVFDPSWPSPFCPRGARGKHELVRYEPGWVCDRCGAMVKLADVIRLDGWWKRIALQFSESYVQN